MNTKKTIKADGYWNGEAVITSASLQRQIGITRQAIDYHAKKGKLCKVDVPGISHCFYRVSDAERIFTPGEDKFFIIFPDSSPITDNQMAELMPVVPIGCSIKYAAVNNMMDEEEIASIIEDMTDSDIVFSAGVPELIVALRCSVRLAARTYLLFNPHQDKTKNWEVIQIQ